MRSGFKTFVSFAIGVLLATLCTAETSRTTTPVPILCLNGRIVSPDYGFLQYCECNAGFMGYACDQPIPTIRCVNGVIGSAGTDHQYCMCNDGFIGPACDVDQPQWCVGNGKTYQNGERFNIDCNFCSCQNGVIICTEMVCEAISTTPPPIRCVNGAITDAGTVWQRCECFLWFTGEACDLAILTTPPPIRCDNGVIARAGTVLQHCVCSPGFIGAACDNAIPTIRCVNGVIGSAGTDHQYCMCNDGFIGPACDVDQPQWCGGNGKTYQNGERFNIDCNFCSCQNGFIICTQEVCAGSMRNNVFLIVGVSVGALMLVAVIMAVVIVCKRRQRLNNQQTAEHARRLPRDLRTGVSHGIYAISGDNDVMLPPYTPPKFPPPYDHLDYNRAGLVEPPPSYHTNPGYETMSSVRKQSVRDENVSVKSDNVKSQKADK